MSSFYGDKAMCVISVLMIGELCTLPYGVRNASMFYYCNMGKNINIRTVKDMKAHLDEKIDKLASSESISDIKALVQEQPNSILKLAETVNSLKERIDKLEDSLIECENLLEVSKTVSSCLIKKCDDLQQ